MSTEMQIALVGVIGTLVGTLLGWLLNNISQSGKLNVFVSSFIDSFKHNEVGCMVPSSSVEQAEHYSYKLTLDLYNSSGQTKILRNLTIVFSDGKRVLFESVPHDDRTKRKSGPVCFYDEISPVNIPPKTIIQLNLHNGFGLKRDNTDFIWNVQKIYLTYIDEKNKLKKVNIKSEHYCHHFESHKKGG